MTDTFHDVSWQGVRLAVPADWELGRVDGDGSSGYARLDDANMVRAEVEWRAAPARGARRPVADLVDRYIEQLEKKAGKSDLEFSVQRQAKFLKDKRWLEGSEYETFIWEADYRAYNLARACPDCHRIILLRVLTKVGDNAEALVNRIMPTLEDHPRDDHGGRTLWSLYGMRFLSPAGYDLTEHELKSGHIRLTFEKDRGRQMVRVHRLSMAQMLLKERTIPRGCAVTRAYASRARRAAAGGRSCGPCRWSIRGPVAGCRERPGTVRSRTASVSSSTWSASRRSGTTTYSRT
jgi:hypothetical protein